MHHYAWWRAEGDGVDQGLFYVPQAESQLTVFSQVGGGGACWCRTGHSAPQPRRRTAKPCCPPPLPALLHTRAVCLHLYYRLMSPPGPRPPPRVCSIMTCLRCRCALLYIST